jgi:hypothetical protein
MSELHAWIEICVGISVIVLFFIKINQDRDSVIDKIESDVRNAKEIVDRDLTHAKEEGDEKRGRLYQRLDEVKIGFELKLETFRQYYEERHEKLRKEIATEYVAAKMCDLMHDTTTREMTEIKKRLDDVVEELKKMNERLFKEKRA